jgi:hypothetical protein
VFERALGARLEQGHLQLLLFFHLTG